MRRAVFAAVLIALAGVPGHKKASFEQRYAATLAELRRGNTEAAVRSLAELHKDAEKAGDSYWDWRFRLLQAEIEVRYPTRAKESEAVSATVPAGSQYDDIRARQKYVQGLSAVVHQKFEAALPALRAAQDLAKRSRSQDVWIDARILEGSSLMRQQKWQESDSALQDALKAAEQARDPYRTATSLMNLGVSRLRRGRFDAALPYFERALKANGSDTGPLAGSVSTNIGICASRLGEFDQALAVQERARAALDKSGDRLHLQQALGETGNTLLLAGRTEDATKSIRRALEISRTLEGQPEAATWAGNLSIAYAALGQWDKAEQFNNQAIEFKKQLPSSSTIYNVLNAARIAAGRGRNDEAIELYEQCLRAAQDLPSVLWEAHAGLGDLYAEQRPALASHNYESALAIIERTRSELLKPEYKFSYLSRLIHFYRQYVDWLCRRGQWETALAIADSSRARVLAERSENGAPKRLSTAAIRAIGARSGPVLFFWLAPERSYAWVISSEGIRSFTLAPEAEIQRRVNEYRKVIDDTLVDPLAKPIPAAVELAKMVLDPVSSALPRGGRVLLVPDGALNSLNLETLPVYGDRPHYWIEDAEVRIAPSLTVLAAVAHVKQGGTRSLLLIGDPQSPDSSLPPLKSAAGELDAVARHFPAASASVYRRKEATPRAYEQGRPGEYSFIHFTAHALANPTSPLDSAIALSPSGSGYKLYARDIVQLPLRANLVTISSCRGAGARAYTGEGLVGFAWAFLRAGASNVIAGLWDVNDESTARLMGELYTALEKRPPSDALHEAKLSLLHAGGRYARPYYWGPFQLYTAAQ